MAVALIGFVCNSYPMMRPGFDMWWHLGMIDAPQLADPAAFPASRVFWHHVWHQALELLAVNGLFERAVFIHRVQAMLTIALITLGAYLSLRTLTQRKSTSSSELWLAAMLSAVIWLLMHGTESTARGGGPDAHYIQSWLMWYSINYQISLPFYVVAVGATLYALSPGENRPAYRAMAAALATASIALATLFHAAETAYFILCVGVLVPLYLRGKKAWLLLGLISAFGGLAVWATVQRLHIAPALIKMVLANDWGALLDQALSQGNQLTTRGLNRIETAWHAMHTTSAVALSAAALIKWRVNQTQQPQDEQHWRPWAFVAITALFPLALMQPLSAGILSMVTHINIAWRFSLASFLFIAIPLLGLWIAVLAQPTGVLRRQLIVTGTVFACATTALTYSHANERKQPSIQFAKSLLRSLHPVRVYFGLSKTELEQLKEVVRDRQSPPNSELICTDLFTAYYLFFVMGYQDVNLPTAFRYVPGYRPADPNCRFEFSAESLPR